MFPDQLLDIVSDWILDGLQICKHQLLLDSEEDRYYLEGYTFVCIYLVADF